MIECTCILGIDVGALLNDGCHHLCRELDDM